MLQRVIGEDVQLICHPAPEACTIKVDRGQVEQVLVNLAVNARDAMPQGGSLTIRTRHIHWAADDVGQLLDVAPGWYIQMAVSDTGFGMNREVLVQAFEPFFTTKGPGKGTGLGLATSYGIVKQHGGHMTIYSEPNMGTTVNIYFPVVSTTASTTPEFSPAPATGGGERILLVEDDAAVRRIAVRILERLGYLVVEAQNAAEALAILEDEEHQFDLLLTDVVMPGMQGRELAEIVSERRPEIRTLFATGYSQDRVLQGRLVRQEVTVIQKPFTIDGLARAVRQALDEQPSEPFEQEARLAPPPATS